jgi:hypothetical protein
LGGFLFFFLFCTFQKAQSLKGLFTYWNHWYLQTMSRDIKTVPEPATPLAAQRIRKDGHGFGVRVHDSGDVTAARGCKDTVQDGESKEPLSGEDPEEVRKEPSEEAEEYEGCAAF